MGTRRADCLSFLQPGGRPKATYGRAARSLTTSPPERPALPRLGANGESRALRVYAAKAVTGYEAQILQARAIAGSL